MTDLAGTLAAVTLIWIALFCAISGVVTIAWRGTASLSNGTASACGSATGNYGANNEFRRILQIPTYFDPTI